MWLKPCVYLQPKTAFKHLPIVCSDGSKQLQNKKKQWKQSGKGTEPIPWSPIIRCARPWRETRAQSAMNKGAREGGVVTVTKMFCDRHLFPMRCLYHRGKSKSIFQPLVVMLWATSKDCNSNTGCCFTVYFFCVVVKMTENNKMLSNPTNSFNIPSVFIIFWLYSFEHFAGRTSCPLYVKWCWKCGEV